LPLPLAKTSTVLPDGSTASEVIGPDGNVVFEAGPDIPDSAIAQYDATALSLSDQDTVSTWGDELGSADLSATTGSPTYLSDGINGNPSVATDGDDLTVSSFGVTPPYTVAVVTERKTGTQYGRLWYDPADDYVRHEVRDLNNEHNIDASSNSITGWDAQNDRGEIHLIVVDSSDSLFRANGVDRASGTISGDEDLANFGLANGSGPTRRQYKGWYGEVVVYDQALSSGEIAEEESRLSDKWGITI